MGENNGRTLYTFQHWPSLEYDTKFFATYTYNSMYTVRFFCCISICLMQSHHSFPPSPSSFNTFIHSTVMSHIRFFMFSQQTIVFTQRSFHTFVSSCLPHRHHNRRVFTQSCSFRGSFDEVCLHFFYDRPRIAPLPPESLHVPVTEAIGAGGVVPEERGGERERGGGKGEENGGERRGASL